MKRICPVCKNEFDGRADKKFCCDQCRNTYNNELKKKDTQFTYQVNRILAKNRSILCKLYEKYYKSESEKKTVSVLKGKLLKEGFNFEYMTNIFTSRYDRAYFFCYDYGYYIDNEFVVIVKNIKDDKKN